MVGPLISALAAGNATILKPSEFAPATGRLPTQMVAAVFPADLVCVKEGDHTVSEQLLTLPFDHVFFTGSAPVGKIVHAAAAQLNASVTLELGGQCPVIVCADADLEVIRLVIGDAVKLEMSPYDMDKARIVYRIG